MSRREIAGLRVVVTGASGGIGEALARELANRGASVLVTARREEPLRQLVDGLRSAGRSAHYVVGDVSDPAVRREILEAAQSQLGGLDVLVNNAGVGAFGLFAEADEARLRRVMEVDFFAMAELTRSALPLLRAGRTPAIVNIASILGHRGIPLASEYCAAKFAVRGFSESLRTELAPDGIDVLVVSPGSTDTGFYNNVLEMRAKLPWRKAGSSRGTTPQAVAVATAWALERRKNEIIPSFSGRLLVLANRIAPRLLDRIMRRYV